MIKFKSDQTELKLNKVLYCINEMNKTLNDSNYIYDDKDINALSSVFNLPESDIKKIYDNYESLQFISLAKSVSKSAVKNITEKSIPLVNPDYLKSFVK